jgi:hypothetical protein
MDEVETGRRVFGKLPLSNPSKQIRKLRFLPVEHDDAIRCELTVHDLDKNDISYVAISYVWGSKEDERMVEINGAEVRVRINCWYALWQVRRVNSESYYWIDSLCINQADSAEKSAQVKLMASIYSGAEFVAACIGPLHKWYSPSKYLEKYQNNSRGTHIEAVLTEDELDDYESQLNDLLEELRRLSYFSRLWVVQECMLAKHIEVYWGELHVPWASLVPLVDNRFAPKHYNLVKFLEDAILPQEQLSLLWIILVYAGKGCSEAHDTIYGLLSMFSSAFQQKIRVDYNQPLLALLRNFIRAFKTLDARSMREIECHAQRSIFELMVAVENLSEHWRLGMFNTNFEADLQGFLNSSERNASEFDSVETHFKVQISDYFWWPIQWDAGASGHDHCALLRRGHVLYAGNHDISRRMEKIHRDLSHMPAIAEEFITLHIRPVAVDVPFPAGEFRVPAQTEADDILLFIQQPRKHAVDGGSMFLILRRSKEGANIFDLVGFAAAVKLLQNKDYDSERRGEHVKLTRPELTAFLHPDDVLTLALNRTTRQTHLRNPPSTLTQASYVEAPAEAFNDSGPLYEARADVYVKSCIEAAERDSMSLETLAIDSG